MKYFLLFDTKIILKNYKKIPKDFKYIYIYIYIAYNSLFYPLNGKQLRANLPAILPKIQLSSTFMKIKLFQQKIFFPGSLDRISRDGGHHLLITYQKIED